MFDTPRAYISPLTVLLTPDADGNFTTDMPTLAVQSRCPKYGFREWYRGSDENEANRVLADVKRKIGA